jgi:predicted ArsR family transcriptional regulator
MADDLPSTKRARVFLALQASESSARELASRLSLSLAAVRRALNDLQRTGHVKAAYYKVQPGAVEPKDMRGRIRDNRRGGRPKKGSGATT